MRVESLVELEQVSILILLDNALKDDCIAIGWNQTSGFNPNSAG